MHIELQVPDYSPQHGFHMEFEEDYTIDARIEDGVVIVTADHGGLVTLARLLLTLAQPSVPVGYDVELDEWSGLEAGSCRITFVKTDHGTATTSGADR